MDDPRAKAIAAATSALELTGRLDSTALEFALADLEAGDYLGAAAYCRHARRHAVEPAAVERCRLAFVACVDAWEASRPAADLRQEALAALDALRPLIGITDPVAASALDKRAELDMGIDTMLRGIREDEVPEVKAACYHAVVALIRWREAKEAARGTG